MKLQIDTKEKTISVLEKVNLNELYENLKKLLPQGEWKDFSLEVNAQIIWTNPIVINPYIPVNPYPWYNPTYVTAEVASSTYDIGISYGSDYILNEGTYNIDIQ